MKVPITQKARYNTTCPHCGKTCRQGIDEVKVDADKWVHVECYSTYRADRLKKNNKPPLQDLSTLISPKLETFRITRVIHKEDVVEIEASDIQEAITKAQTGTLVQIVSVIKL